MQRLGTWRLCAIYKPWFCCNCRFHRKSPRLPRPDFRRSGRPSAWPCRAVAQAAALRRDRVWMWKVSDSEYFDRIVQTFKDWERFFVVACLARMSVLLAMIAQSEDRIFSAYTFSRYRAADKVHLQLFSHLSKVAMTYLASERAWHFC